MNKLQITRPESQEIPYKTPKSNKVKLKTRRHAFSKLTINHNSQDQKLQISPVGQKSKLQGVVKITPVKNILQHI